MIVCVCPNPSIDTLVAVNDLSPGKVHRARAEERFPGGKGVHVALAAAELGSEVILVGFWAGPTGKWIREQCQRMNVKTVGPEVPGWSRSCITFKSNGPYNETELLGIGPTVNEKLINELEEIVAEVAVGASVVTLSGSWPPGAPADGYARLVSTLGGEERPAMLDCTGDCLEWALALHPDTIHLNRHEAKDATGMEDPISAARGLAESCNLAVVTAGAAGAYFSREDKTLHAKVDITAKYSSVGSGDCLLAGLAVARARGLTLKEAAALAVACGAANCLRPEIGMLRRRDVEELVEQVDITEIQ